MSYWSKHLHKPHIFSWNYFDESLPRTSVKAGSIFFSPFTLYYKSQHPSQSYEVSLINILLHWNTLKPLSLSIDNDKDYIIRLVVPSVNTSWSSQFNSDPGLLNKPFPTLHLLLLYFISAVFWEYCLTQQRVYHYFMSLCPCRDSDLFESRHLFSLNKSISAWLFILGWLIDRKLFKNPKLFCTEIFCFSEQSF